MSTLNLTIDQGKTFTRTFYWAVQPYIYKAITACDNAAPIGFTVASHGLTAGWPFWVAGAGNLTPLSTASTAATITKTVNAASDPPSSADLHFATVADANTVKINDINGALLKTYTSGGYIQYLTPVDLTGYSARMNIKSRIGGTTLWTGSTALGDFAIDVAANTIILTIAPAVTAAFDFLRGTYDIEMFTAADASVSLLASGAVTVNREVTA